MTNVFKAYDIRGVYGSEIDEALAYRVGLALGQFLLSGDVVVGRDARAGSISLAQEIGRGLTESGRQVIDIGLVSTDMVYFSVGKLGCAGGAMITASHNPPSYNGIKLCGSQARPIGIESGLDKIRNLAKGTSQLKAKTPGKLELKNMVEPWLEHVLGFIDSDKLKPYKLAVDTGNGVAGTVFAELEPYLPFEITELYFDPDGRFPNHEANPSDLSTLEEVVACIKKNKLDGGIAFDGDGDRAVLIDETGQLVSGSTVTAVLAEHFLKLYPKSPIVYSAVTSNSVKKIVEKNGGRPVVSRVGHSYVKQLMREHDAPFGGEASAHYYFRDNWYADSGLIAMLIALYIASTSSLRLSALNKRYNLYETSPEINFTVADKKASLAKIKKAYSSFDQDYLDGITVRLNQDNWFNVRASNTEPLLRLNVETKTGKQLNQLISDVSKLIET